MALYLVVHHRSDPDQPWANAWQDEYCLRAIQTTAEIGTLCEQARRTGERVYVHRCGCGSFAPTVCCSVSVARVHVIDRGTSLVEFQDAARLNLTPRVQPGRGQNWYDAEPV